MATTTTTTTPAAATVPATTAAPAAVKPAAPRTAVIFVQNLPLTASADQLTQFFAKHATVKGVLISSAKEGSNTLCSFVEVDNSDDAAAKVVAALDGSKAFPGQQEQPLKLSTGNRNNKMSNFSLAAAAAAPKEASKTVMYVSNLPFIVDEDSLKNQIFAGWKVKEAKIARFFNGMSKGFGFVEFDDEEECKKAVAFVDHAVVENREIFIRPAFIPLPPLNPPRSKPQTSTTPSTTAAAPAVPQETSKKLFLSNLVAKITEEDIRKLFTKLCNIVSVSVVGCAEDGTNHAIVELERAEDSLKAFNALHHRNVLGSLIEVELMGVHTQPIPRAPRPPRPAFAAAAAAPFRGTSAPRGAPRGGFAPRGRAPFNPRRPYAPRAAAPVATTAPAPVAATTPVATTTTAPMRKSIRPVRRPREDRPLQEENKLGLYLGNLPYIVDEDGMQQIFEGMNPKEVIVARWPSGKSKGFGFATFHTEEECKKAFENVDKAVVEDREIHVRFIRGALATAIKPTAPVTTATAPAPAVAVAAPATTAQ